MRNHRDLLADLGLTETAEAARRQYWQKVLDKADTAYVSLAFLRSSRILASVLSLLLAFRQSDILLTLEYFRQNKARSDKAAPASASPPRFTTSCQCDKNMGGDIVGDLLSGLLRGLECTETRLAEQRRRISYSEANRGS